MSIRVKAIGVDGGANTSYTGTFFLIVAGDDSAEFPAGAHSIPNGQSDITISGITFSQAGTMTLTVRDQNNLEVSKTITVSAAGTTTTTTGTTGTITTGTTSGTVTSTSTGTTTTTGTTAPSCTGTLPTNSTILANVGTTSRAWSYDSSLTGPYQNCSFKCAAGYSYIGTSCVAPTTGTTAGTGTLTTSTTTSGTALSSTTGATTSTTAGTTSGTATSGTVTTTSGSTTSSTSITGTTTGGTTGGTTTISTGITGPVSISDIKDCWFGDTTRRITLADFIGYQATPSTNSGLIYMDEVLLYGGTAPAANAQMTNIFSYEESEWIAGDDTVATSTQLTNFFAFRTNSPGTRTWNIPTTGIKFYGCFSRDDRPTTW